MKDPRMMVPEDVSNPKSHKKKAGNNVPPPTFQAQGEYVRGVKQQTLLPSPPLKTSKKALKRNLMPEDSSSPPFQQQPERTTTSDSLPDFDEHRNLRRKFLLLEDESFRLGKEVLEVEDEVKTMEDEKLALLDQLVVLEGLIDPSELQSHHRSRPT